MESTGVYSRAILDFLHTAGFAVYLIQPSRVHHFAGSIGQHAKTDKIDSMLIAQFGAKNTPRIYTPPGASTEQLRGLVDRRDQVIDDRTRESNRLEACTISSIQTRIKRHMTQLEKEETSLSKKIRAVLAGKM